MVFVPKARERRYKGAFGTLNVSHHQLRQELKACLQQTLRRVSRTKIGELGSRDLKQLRSRFAHAMACDVIFQPVGWKKGQHPKNPKKYLWEKNPIWDHHAPPSAYYKAKRLSSLLNDIVLYGCYGHILHELERLSIHIWNMSRDSFDGLCRLIRSKIYKSLNRLSSAWADLRKQSPEATEAESLTVKPAYGRVNLRTRRRNMGFKSRNAGPALLSTSVDVVLYALKRGVRYEA